MSSGLRLSLKAFSPSRSAAPVDPAQPMNVLTTLESFPVPRLPCTSAAFQFSHKKEPRRPLRGQVRRMRLSHDASPREGENMTPDEVRRLRADALRDLQRSVAESGEGLASRLRDWERTGRPSRPVLDVPQRSWRRDTAYYGTPAPAGSAAELSDDDDDIVIVDKPAPSPVARSPPYKKRALSLSVMDVDMPDEDADSPFACLGERSSSPTRPSDFSSDDENVDMDTDLASSGVFSTPALSHTYSASTNSSLVSLSLSLQGGENAAATRPPAGLSGYECQEGGSVAPASHSEKAIAALTLAMANGAAGISDYEALRLQEVGLTTLDATYAGELWN